MGAAIDAEADLEMKTDCKRLVICYLYSLIANIGYATLTLWLLKQNDSHNN